VLRVKRSGTRSLKTSGLWFLFEQDVTSMLAAGRRRH
jgi:hypothetical protein